MRFHRATQHTVDRCTTHGPLTLCQYPIRFGLADALDCTQDFLWRERHGLDGMKTSISELLRVRCVDASLLQDRVSFVSSTLIIQRGPAAWRLASGLASRILPPPRRLPALVGILQSPCWVAAGDGQSCKVADPDCFLLLQLTRQWRLIPASELFGSSTRRRRCGYSIAPSAC